MMHLQKNTEWMLHNSDSLFDHEHRLVAIKCKTNWMKVGFMDRVYVILLLDNELCLYDKREEMPRTESYKQ